MTKIIILAALLLAGRNVTGGFCGLKMPHAAAGTSLRPVLAKSDATGKDAAFTLVSRGPKLSAQSVRTARWRFTRWSDGQTELYDHDQDPGELRNVADQQGAVVKELTNRLQSLPKVTT